MSPLAAFVKWGLLGALVAVTLLVGQALAVGGAAAMMQVGEMSPLRTVIESELPDAQFVPDGGHDGHLYYAIASDLAGDEVPRLIDHPSYRYRRILFPAVASGFGSLGGGALLVGMMVTVVLSTALAAGSVASAARMLGRTDWLALAVILNPGVWLSVRLLTADVLAVALMSLGLLGYLARPKLGIAAFSLSVLAKEPYLLTPAGISFSDFKRRWHLLVVPLVMFASWAAWVGRSVGAGTSGELGNLAFPFVGMLGASSSWHLQAAEEWLYLLFAFVSTSAALGLGLFHRSWLRWSLLAWGVLGITASQWVWRWSNNIARALAPIAILVVLALAQSGRPTAEERHGAGSGRQPRMLEASDLGA